MGNRHDKLPSIPFDKICEYLCMDDMYSLGNTCSKFQNLTREFFQHSCMKVLSGNSFLVKKSFLSQYEMDLVNKIKSRQGLDMKDLYLMYKILVRRSLIRIRMESSKCVEWDEVLDRQVTRVIGRGHTMCWHMDLEPGLYTFTIRVKFAERKTESCDLYWYIQMRKPEDWLPKSLAHGLAQVKNNQKNSVVEGQMMRWEEVREKQTGWARISFTRKVVVMQEGNLQLNMGSGNMEHNLIIDYFEIEKIGQ